MSLPAFLASGVPTTTTRTYRAAFRRWWIWCNGRGAKTIPVAADPVELATYVHHLTVDVGASWPYVNVQLAAIRRAHLVMGAPDATGHPLIRMARRAARNARKTGAGQPACDRLTLALLVNAARSQVPATLALRDVAILTLMWWGALRRSECAALLSDDVSVQPAGLCLHVVGKGGRIRFVGVVPSGDDTCAVAAWHAWAAVRPQESPHAWGRVHPRGVVGHRGVSSETIRDTIQRAERLAGLPSTGTHALRIGAATQMFTANAPVPAVMLHCGWESAETALGYYRRAAVLGPDNPMRALIR